jgi:CheY-like chemotaxis protein
MCYFSFCYAVKKIFLQELNFSFGQKLFSFRYHPFPAAEHTICCNNGPGIHAPAKQLFEDNMNKRNLSILIADDDADDKDLFREALHETGESYTINTVSNGQELMDYLHGHSYSLPDVIFLDLNMPIKDGREALKEIKGDKQLCSIPVIIFSTSNSIHDINFSYSYGANLFVVKPFEFTGLANTLSTICVFLKDVVQLPKTGKYAVPGH